MIAIFTYSNYVYSLCLSIGLIYTRQFEQYREYKRILGRLNLGETLLEFKRALLYVFPFVGQCFDKRSDEKKEIYRKEESQRRVHEKQRLGNEKRRIMAMCEI